MEALPQPVAIYAALNGTPLRAWSASDGWRLGSVRHRLRKRRLLDLLRPRPGGGSRPRPHPAGLPVRRRPVRSDGQNLRRGRRHVPRSGRLIIVRAPCLRRRGLVLRRLGAESRLHPHHRHLGVLRPALPERLPGAACPQPQPRRHLRRADRGGAARRAEHPRPRRVGQAQLRPRDPRPEHAGAARGRGRRARAEPVAADPPGAPGQRPQLERTDLRPLAGDAGLHGHRDRGEHGRGVARSRHPGAQGGQPRGAGRARRLCRDLRRGALGAAHRPPWRRLQPRAAAELRPSRLCHGPGGLLPKRPRSGDHLAAGPARDGAQAGSVLRRHPRRNHPVHRHQRRA